jgi:ferrochelatase
MAHGTPTDPSEIEAFYTRIRRGRPPTAEQLADLEARYRAIGGVSPLAERTQAQVRGLADLLEAAAPGRYLVRYGAKFTDPTIEAAAAALSPEVDRVIGLVLTPHGSSMGSGEYLRRAAAALSSASSPPDFLAVAQWYDAPGFADLVAARVREALYHLPEGARDDAVVLFSAHSLPRRVVDEGDPYPDQVAESAALIAGKAGIDRWSVAWQSAGRTPEPWIGPDILEILRALPGEGAVAAVVCPLGFVADHLEVLYDLDVEARRVAVESGLAFGRTESLNDDPRFLTVLAGIVQSAAAGPEAG